MPTSRSAPPNAKTAAQSAAKSPPKSLRRPLIVLAALALLAIILIALPASMMQRFLPAPLAADDFSGNLWHGSAGRLTLNGRDFGALEWRLHPASLLAMTLAVDLHWVKEGFVADARARLTREIVTVHELEGGGLIDDLRDLGIAQGWHGTAHFSISDLTAALSSAADSGAAGAAGAVGGPRLMSIVGDVNVLNLTSPQVADGVDLGGYALHFADGAITPDIDGTAELSDTGGPLEVQGNIRFAADGHGGTLSATLKERPDAPQKLRSQMQNLTQLHARDAQGRIPVDLEFTL